MKHKVMMGIVVIAGLAGTPLFGADEPNAVNPELTKLVQRLDAEIDKLAPVMPEGVSEEDQTKLTEEFDLLKSFVKANLAMVCTNKVFVQEVASQNAKNVSLEEIQQIDKQWVEAEDELPIHVQKMGNACAKEIIRLAKERPVLGETFVMDNQGANVGQNALTSDYWQGDEPKWKNSFRNGKGGIEVGSRKFDRSTGAVDQKVSLPIINEHGKVIGAVCLGINVEALKQVAVAAGN